MAVATGSPAATEHDFDPDDLQRILDGPHRELREQIRAILSRPEFAPTPGLDLNAYREQVMGWMRTIAESGVGVPGYPSAYGGSDDPAANVVAFETIGYGDLSLLVKFGVQFGLWGGAVHQLGTKIHHDRYLAQTARAEMLGCFAMTEAGHGSNVQALETTATYDPSTEEFVVNTPSDDARKEYIGGAGRTARMAAVFAQLIVGGENHGVHCLVVPIRDQYGRDLPGVRTADDGLKAGLNGVDNGMLWFEDVRVPREALLNRYADVSPDGVYSSTIENPNKRFFTMLGTLVQGRVCVGAASLSAAKTALTIAIRHSLRRVQFGPSEGAAEVPLLTYRTHQRRLLPLLARTYALHFAQQELTERFATVMAQGDAASDSDRRALETLAAGLKAANSWHAMETIQTCREACGGAGYMAENRIGGLRDDIDIFTTFEGDNTVLTMLCARGLLSDYAHDFGGLNPVELVGFVAGQAVETVVERLFARQVGQIIADWIPTRGGGHQADGEEGPLSDPAYLLDLFEWRQGHITAAVANRFRRGLAENTEPFEVLRRVQDHLLRVGTTYVDTFAFRAFRRAVDDCEEPAVKEALAAMLSLYALASVEADKGFYLEHGRLISTRTKQVTREVNQLCGVIARQAGPFVDAFGIPDAILTAPIGIRHPA
jgi:acyl-CoA oxidase